MLVDSATVMCMLNEPICHFRDVWSIMSLLFYFRWKIPLVNSVGHDQTPHNVESDMGLHCLPMTFYGFLGKNGLIP